MSEISIAIMMTTDSGTDSKSPDLFSDFESAFSKLVSPAPNPFFEEHSATYQSAVGLISLSRPSSASVMSPLRNCIVIEGLDGSGKSTLAQNLADSLHCWKTKTPPNSLTFARFLFDSNSVPSASARSFYTLSNYVAAREIQSSADVTQTWVVDRFYFSTLAYTIGTWCHSVEHVASLPQSLFQWPLDLPMPGRITRVFVLVQLTVYFVLFYWV